MSVLKDLKFEDIIYQKASLKIKALSSMEKTFMTKQLTQILKDRRNLKSENEDRLMNFRISRSFGSPEKMFSINFSKANTIFARVCIIRMIIVIFLLMDKKYLSLKPTMKMLTFQLSFISEVYLMNLVPLGLEKYL